MGFHFNVLSQGVKGSLEFRYFGTAGFEITNGKTTILLDPYILASGSISSTPICPDDPITNTFAICFEDNKKDSNNKFGFC